MQNLILIRNIANLQKSASIQPRTSCFIFIIPDNFSSLQVFNFHRPDATEVRPLSAGATASGTPTGAAGLNRPLSAGASPPPRAPGGQLRASCTFGLKIAILFLSEKGETLYGVRVFNIFRDSSSLVWKKTSTVIAENILLVTNAFS